MWTETEIALRATRGDSPDQIDLDEVWARIYGVPVPTFLTGHEPDEDELQEMQNEVETMLMEGGYIDVANPFSPRLPVVGGDIEALRKWVFVAGDNVFFNTTTGERMNVAAFDLAMASITPAVEVEKDGLVDFKKFKASRTAVEFLGCAVVAATLYLPNFPDRVIAIDGISYANEYLESTVPRRCLDWQRHPAWRAVKDHIYNLVPDGADQLILWLAHNVQRPGVKVLWAPVLVGVEGDGKTFIAQGVLSAAMGSRHVKPVSAETLHSDFTSWGTGACVRVLEEIRIQGERRTAVMDKLKPLITNGDVEIVRKGKDGQVVPNVTNYIGLTNHEDALAVTLGDRRWAVWRTRFQSREQAVKETGPSYWGPLYEAIQQHGDVLRGWLLSIDLTDFDRTQAPEVTEAKLAMISAARSVVASDVEEVIALGGPGIAPTVIATDSLNEQLRQQGGRPLSTKALNGVLAEAGWSRHDQTVKWGGRNRRLYYRADHFDGLSGIDLSRALRLSLELSQMPAGAQID